MKIVHTFWIDQGKDPIKDSFGWCSAPYHLMSWALSCLQLHQFFDNIELITDSKGKELLIDQMKLPYKKVRVELDDLDLVQIPGLWVMKKIYSYTLNEEPFLNVDGDVFIFESFPNDLLSGQLIAQNIDQGFGYYNELVGLVEKTFPFVPKPIKGQIRGLEVQASNAGILGGSDYEFFKEYYQVVEQFIATNYWQIRTLSPSQMVNFNAVVEQYIFYCLSSDRNIEVKYLLDTVYDQSFSELSANFHFLPYNFPYFHALGNYKKNGWVCDQLAYRLRLDYPEYYTRINDIFESSQKDSLRKTIPDSTKTLPSKVSSFSVNYLAKPENEKFYRTEQILSAICEKEFITWDRNKFTISAFTDYLNKNLYDTITLRLLNDVYEFETEKLRLIELLPHDETVLEDEFSAIQSANQILKDKFWQERAELKLAPQCKTILSEWDWAQNSELFTRIKMNSIENNLLIPPNYYQTLLLWDKHHVAFIEYLLGPIGAYLLSILSQENYLSVKESIEKINEFFEMSSKNQLRNLFEEEIRFLAYSGVIILREKVD